MRYYELHFECPPCSQLVNVGHLVTFSVLWILWACLVQVSSARMVAMSACQYLLLVFGSMKIAPAPGRRRMLTGDDA